MILDTSILRCRQHQAHLPSLGFGFGFVGSFNVQVKTGSIVIVIVRLAMFLGRLIMVFLVSCSQLALEP